MGTRIYSGNVSAANLSIAASKELSASIYNADSGAENEYDLSEDYDASDESSFGDAPAAHAAHVAHQRSAVA